MTTITVWGAQFVSQYPEHEYEDSLRRAFSRADFIVLDSHPSGQRFLAACASWAIRKGYLSHTRTVDEGQSEIYEFRLTTKGRDWLDLP